MNEAFDGIAVATETGKLRPGGYMHSTILRIEADVEARKRPRGETWATVRSVAFVVIALFTAFEV